MKKQYYRHNYMYFALAALTVQLLSCQVEETATGPIQAVQPTQTRLSESLRKKILAKGGDPDLLMLHTRKEMQAQMENDTQQHQGLKEFNPLDAPSEMALNAHFAISQVVIEDLTPCEQIPGEERCNGSFQIGDWIQYYDSIYNADFDSCVYEIKEYCGYGEYQGCYLTYRQMTFYGCQSDCPEGKIKVDGQCQDPNGGSTEGDGDIFCSITTDDYGNEEENCFSCPGDEKIVFSNGKPSGCSVGILTDTQSAPFGVKRVYDMQKLNGLCVEGEVQ